MNVTQEFDDAYKIILNEKSWKSSALKSDIIGEIGLDSPESLEYLCKLSAKDMERLQEGIKPLYWSQLMSLLKLKL